MLPQPSDDSSKSSKGYLSKTKDFALENPQITSAALQTGGQLMGLGISQGMHLYITSQEIKRQEKHYEREQDLLTLQRTLQQENDNRKINFQEAMHCYNKGLNMKAEGKFKEAANELKNSTKNMEGACHNPMFDSERNLLVKMYFNWSIVLYLAKQFDNIDSILDKLLLIKPSHSDALNLKGKSLYKLNKLDEASICFRGSLDLRRGQKEISIYIDYCSDQHRNVIKKVNALGESTIKLASYELLKLQGHSYLAISKFGEAATSFAKALSLIPKEYPNLKDERNELLIECGKATQQFFEKQKNSKTKKQNSGVLITILKRISKEWFHSLHPLSSFKQFIFQVHNPNSNNDYFKLEVMPEDGDCGYHTIGIERNEAIKLLLEVSNNALYRTMAAPEITSHFLVEDFCQKLLKNLGTNENLKKRHMALLKRIKATDNTPEQTEQLDKDILLFCSEEAVYLAYVNNFITRKSWWMSYQPNTTSFLDVIANVAKLNIKIWSQNSNNASKLILSHHIKPKDISRTVNMFHTGLCNIKNHFNRLVVTDAPDEFLSNQQEKNLTQVDLYEKAAFLCFREIIDCDPYNISCLEQLATHHKDALAQAYLSECYAYGMGVDRDYDKAFRLAQLSVTQKNIYGTVGLGLCYLSGWGTERNPHRAKELYEQAIRASGLTLNMNDNGSVELVSDGSQSDEILTFGLKATSNLATIYYQGLGVDANAQLAFNIYKKTAAMGCQFGKFNLATMYIYGTGGQEKNYNTAKIKLDGIESNIQPDQKRIHGYVMKALGFLYENGYGVERDYIKAYDYYSKANNLYCLNASNPLGNLFYNGHLKTSSNGHIALRTTGTPINFNDYQKAFNYYLAVEDVPNIVSDAKFNLATCYLHGKGTDINFLRARQLYTIALQEGFVRANYNLGLMAVLGLVEPLRTNRTVETYFRATENHSLLRIGRNSKYWLACLGYMFNSNTLPQGNDVVNSLTTLGAAGHQESLVLLSAIEKSGSNINSVLAKKGAVLFSKFYNKHTLRPTVTSNATHIIYAYVVKGILHYRIGSFQGNNHTITWSPIEDFTRTLNNSNLSIRHSRMAINPNGYLVEVFEFDASSSAKDKLAYNIWRINPINGNVTRAQGWNRYDVGGSPDIAIHNQTVVEFHCSDFFNAIWFNIWRLDETNMALIKLKSGRSYGYSGARPSAGLLVNNGNLYILRICQRKEKTHKIDLYISKINNQGNGSKCSDKWVISDAIDPYIATDCVNRVILFYRRPNSNIILRKSGTFNQRNKTIDWNERSTKSGFGVKPTGTIQHGRFFRAAEYHVSSKEKYVSLFSNTI